MAYKEGNGRLKVSRKDMVKYGLNKEDAQDKKK